MKLLAGNSSLNLSKKISKYLKSKLVDSNIKKFSDGEVYVEINENIRGNSIFVIQSTSNPANDNLMELLICIDALRRSSVKKYYSCYSLFRLCKTRPKSSFKNCNSSKTSFKFNHQCWSKQNINGRFARRPDSRLF